MHSRLGGLLITVAVLMVPSALLLLLGGYVCGAAALFFTLPMALFALWDFLDAERRLRRQDGAPDVGFAVSPIPDARRADDSEKQSEPPAPS